MLRKTIAIHLAVVASCGLFVRGMHADIVGFGVGYGVGTATSANFSPLDVQSYDYEGYPTPYVIENSNSASTGPFGPSQFHPDWGTLSNATITVTAETTAVLETHMVEYMAPVGATYEGGIGFYTAGAPNETYYEPFESGNLFAWDLDEYSLSNYYDPGGTASADTNDNGDPYSTASLGSSASGYGIIQLDAAAYVLVDGYNYYGTDTPISIDDDADIQAMTFGLAQVTYDYTPPTGPFGPYSNTTVGSSGGGGGGGTVWGGGGSGGPPITGTPPTGGWGIITIATNATLVIESGTTAVAEGIENYGVLDQTGGTLTLSGALDQTISVYSDGTTTYHGGIYNLSGGNATIGSLTGNGIVNMSGGNLTVTTVNHTGVITQSGGTFTVTNFTQTGTPYIDENGNQTIGGITTVRLRNLHMFVKRLFYSTCEAL